MMRGQGPKCWRAKRAIGPVGLTLLSALYFGSFAAWAEGRKERQSSAPRVMSVNLCADLMVLSLADPEQIVSLSYFAGDPLLSPLAEEGRYYPHNSGFAEEIISLHPDLVVTERYNRTATTHLLRQAGYDVLELSPPESLAELLDNIEVLGAALHQSERANSIVNMAKAMMAELAASQRSLNASAKPRALYYGLGGFAPGAGTLFDEMLQLSGFHNLAREQHIEGWGVIPLETILRIPPDILLMPLHLKKAAAGSHPAAHPALRQLPSQHADLDDRRFLCASPALFPLLQDLLRIAKAWREDAQFRNILSSSSQMVP